MRIALAQTDTAQGDFEKNLEKISDFAKAAKDGGAQIAVFPEMCVCGFDYKKNLDYLQTFGNAAEQRLREIAKSRDIAICGSLPHLEAGDPRPSNRMLFVGADGNDIARYDQNPPLRRLPREQVRQGGRRNRRRRFAVRGNRACRLLRHSLPRHLCENGEARRKNDNPFGGVPPPSLGALADFVAGAGD